MTTSRPIVCVDLNGVLDAYTGWEGLTRFDPPRPGARALLEALTGRGYAVIVFTTRYPEDVWTWLRDEAFTAHWEDPQT